MSTSHRVRAQRTGEWQSAAAPGPAGGPAAPTRGVAFDRLLTVASLTPAQASLLAVLLLETAGSSGNGATDDTEDRAGACLGEVTLTPAGEVDVAPPRPGDDTPVTELLDRLLQNARHLPAHPRPEQVRLLRRLEEVARSPFPDPAGRARELEQALTDALGPGARQRTSAQLAALADAFAHVARGRPVPGVAPVPAPQPAPGARTQEPRHAPAAPPHRATPQRGGSRRPARRGRPLVDRRRRPRAVVVALALLVVVAAGGWLVVRGPAAGLLGSIGGATGSTSPAQAAPSRPSGRPAHQPRHRQEAGPALAARQAGRITSVAVRRTGSCRPGSLCPVEVTVRLRPAATSQPITWKVGAARLCRRGITWSAPSTVTARPGWTRVAARSAVPVPPGRSLALVALTTAPARAQSEPVPVTGSSLRC